mmetsp:Transcript_45363/g.71743  ORF Transcript_45363/g.71743 Transcript_45363/m.71743 type:complete len:235 (+) Transcript_45363:711-1415(+)
MPVIIVTLSFNCFADLLTLAILQPCLESCGLTWSNALDPELNFLVLGYLALTVDHELLACDCQVSEPNYSSALLMSMSMAVPMPVPVTMAVMSMAVAVTMTMPVSMPVTMAVPMAITMTVPVTMAIFFILMSMAVAISTSNFFGYLISQIPFELCLAPIVVITIYEFAIHALALDIDLQLKYTIFTPIDFDRLVVFLDGPRCILRIWVNEAIGAISPKLYRKVSILVLQIPFSA